MRGRRGSGQTAAGRPGVLSLGLGIALVVAGLLTSWLVTFPNSLGVMLGSVAYWAVAVSAVVTGVTRLRSKTYEAVPTASLSPGRRSVACRLTGHKEVHRSADSSQPARWECRRCGASSLGHLNVGQAWICEIPLVDHRFVRVRANVDAPERWRCRRCGKLRYTAPVSAGETLEASRTQQLIVNRHEDM